MQKPAPAPIHPLLAERWSPRAFALDAVLSKDELTALAEAARWTPSCFGAEPWFLIFCDRGSDAESWQKALDCLAPPNQLWAKNSALLVVVCAERNFAHNGKPNRHFGYDSGAAGFSLTLQAEALGWRCHQMGGFDAERTRSTFSIPEGCECMTFIAVGKQTAAALPDDLARAGGGAAQAQGFGGEFFPRELGERVGERVGEGGREVKTDFSLLRERILDVPDFPRAGVLFRDITPLLADAEAFNLAVEGLAERCPQGVGAVAAPEARGFIFGAAVALRLGVGFALVRKRGKLPRAALSAEYDLEYGRDAIFMHADALSPGTGVCFG